MRKNIENKTQLPIRDVVLNGLFIAIVFVSTYFIQIRLPISINGGLIHLGNVALFTIAILFGAKKGAVAGAFGMGLFDVLSGWLAWAPFTFVIRGCMGFIIGKIAHSNGASGDNTLKNLLAIVLSGIWMVIGYYITEGLLYGNWVAPVTSIPGNLTQLGLGLGMALPLVMALKRTNLF